MVLEKAFAQAKRGSWGEADYNQFFVFLLLITIALTISIISPSDPSGRIYTDIGFFSLIGIIGAYLAMKSYKKLPLAYAGVSEGDFKISVISGFAVGIMFVLSQFFNYQSFFSPLSIPAVGVFGVGALGSVFLISLYVSEIEETFRASLVLPTINNAVSQFGVAFALFLIGLVLYFFLGFQSYGLIGIGLGVVLLIQRKIAASITRVSYTSTVIALFTSASLFTSLHYLAYRADMTLLASAFMFALIIDTVNLMNRNTVASRIAHTINNGTIAAVGAGLSPFIGLVIGGVHVAILYFVRTTKVKVF